MVVLQCPQPARYRRAGGEVMWISENSQEMDLNNMSPAEQKKAGLMHHGRSLYILTASVNHQGNYSCSQRNTSSQFWFRVTVYTKLSREMENRTRYSMTCYTEESCTLTCPDSDVPDPNTPNITSYDLTWHKIGESLHEVDSYFSNVEKKDSGIYTCIRPYLYDGQIYNMSFTLVLDVQPSQTNMDKHAVITSPRANETIYVDVGFPAVIKCEALKYSVPISLFWLIGSTFVEMNDSLPVFYNSTRETTTEGEKNIVSLVFKKVTEDALSKHYTCKMESLSQDSSNVTISLAQKAEWRQRVALSGLMDGRAPLLLRPPLPMRLREQAVHIPVLLVLLRQAARNNRPSHLSLVLCPVVIVAVMAVTVTVYIKFKIHITLFLRDTLGCHMRISDGKTYDVFLMCYKSDTVTGLNICDRKWLENVLEERFHYKLCLYDRDVLPGQAVAEAVLDCIEQSRSVVLIPSPVDAFLESGLLSVVHAALVQRKTSLVFIKPETTEEAQSGSVEEALQLLHKTGHCVTWEGLSSMLPSSSFWKKLRYHLPAAYTRGAFPLETLPH
ncbi:interleukin-18 receptor 1-like isoform X2 [Dunckerocampus dactyliophorus]|nr:interleukin-18 receptor 1-like isoform X2 [Dunckerocampus dactyliophorus]XP_054626640.1 interleukin-18 receptor 1-like isoform X2 [Dunckerocampus dactyliophorus]XP_054626641.1 interleukin-18 receptor 1-like isoform X2 [Dunckerocampus dactyliophorus]